MMRFTGVFPIFAVILTTFLSGCNGSARPESSIADQAQVARPLPDISAMIRRIVTQDGCQDFTADMRMTSEDESGKKDQIDFKIQRKYAGDRVLTFISVLAPREDADKALLAIEHSDAGTEAFSYLSGLRKLTRLSSGRQLGFRGAKVTVQEMLGMELNQYTHDKGEWVEESGRSLIKVSFREKADRGLAFPRITGFFNDTDQTPQRFELFDLQDQLVKTVMIGEVTTVAGRQTLTNVTIDDLQQKLKLNLITRDVSYDRGIPDAIFTESYLIKFINNASRTIDQ